MKMIKSLLVTVLCVSVMASSLPVLAVEAATQTATTTTAAATTDAATATTSAPATDAQICQDLGLIKGMGDGNWDRYLATKPTKMQAAIILLRLKGLEETAESFKRPDNFADAHSVKNLYQQNILAYLKAHPSLGFQGDGTYFKPNDKVTAQQYYKVLLAALGYKQNTDFEWKDTLTFAADKGLKKVSSVKDLTINDLCTATVEALSAKVKGSDETLVAQLVDRGVINKKSSQGVGLMPQDPVREQKDRAITDLGDTVAPMPTISFVSYNNNKLTISISCADPTAGFHYTYSLVGTPIDPHVDGAPLSSAGNIEILLAVAPKLDTQITVMAYSSVPGKADSQIGTLTIMGSQLLQG